MAIEHIKCEKTSEGGEEEKDSPRPFPPVSAPLNPLSFPHRYHNIAYSKSRGHLVCIEWSVQE